jgi:hypothetical protein
MKKGDRINLKGIEGEVTAKVLGHTWTELGCETHWMYLIITKENKLVWIREEELNDN